MDFVKESSRFPKKLKTLASNAKFFAGNKLLHQFVLDNSEPNNSSSEIYINAVLQSMCDSTSVNALNDEGYTALHLAVLKDNILMVRKLLTRFTNIDVNAMCRYENTPLHLAAKVGNLSIIKELLDKGAEVNIMNKNDHSALYFSAQLNDLEIMEFLIAKGADASLGSEFDTPIFCAAWNNNESALKLLVESGTLKMNWVTLHLLTQHIGINWMLSNC